MSRTVTDGTNDKPGDPPRCRLLFDACQSLPGISPAFGKRVTAGPDGGHEYHQYSAQSPALWCLEVHEISEPAPPKNAIKVAFWNLERGKYIDAAAGLLASEDADVNLLCELDLGMARTSQRHTARDIAARLEQSYAFGTEFIELGLGDRNEQASLHGQVNEKGLHGNAILSKANLTRCALIRLDADDQWFGKNQDERRLGGRIAVAATVKVAGVDVVVVCTHFESRGDPRTRGLEMGKLLAAVDEYAGKTGPVLIAGDLNTNTTSRGKIGDPVHREVLLGADPGRLINPVSYEPLFALAADAGFDWTGCNAAGTTQRPHVEPRYERKLDWILTRGLKARDAGIVAVSGGEGPDLSDHDMITVMIEPETPQ